MKIKYFLFLLPLIFVKDNEIINIPLNTYKKLPKETGNENNSQKKFFIDELINSSLYSFMKIGDPESITKVYIFQWKILILLFLQNIYLKQKEI